MPPGSERSDQKGGMHQAEPSAAIVEFNAHALQPREYNNKLAL